MSNQQKQHKPHKHYSEIVRWAHNPQLVWTRMSNNKGWVLISNPQWNESTVYILDDKWAELRKAQADGKQLQCINNIGTDYTNDILDYQAMLITQPEDWRIAVEYEYQWMIQTDKNYDITSNHYTSKEVAQDNVGEYGTVTESFEPSKRIKNDT